MISIANFIKRIENIDGRYFHPKQLDFFKYALNAINTDTDTEKVTVFSARCGLGKSTFLQMLVQSWLLENEDCGLIIVTDNLNRLRTFYDDSNDKIAYLTAENKQTEIVRQSYCPVLLMSTQRYFQMDSIEPFLTYYDNGKQLQRTTVIFDESPYFREVSEIGIDELNLLHSALNEGITDMCNPTEKIWLLEQYNLFRDSLIQTINRLEQRRTRTTYLFYEPEVKTISEDDHRFMQIVNASMGEIIMKYPSAQKIIKNLFEFLNHGGFFSSFKLHDSNNYHKSFILSKNTRQKILIGKGVKTFIFDATANTSEFYPEDAEWITLHDCEEFTVPLDFININLIDINTSRNSLINQPDRMVRIGAIQNYIQNLNLDISDTLFVSYKTLIEDDVFKASGFDIENAMYFGNTRGFNHNSDKHTYIQVGLNRQSDINYLIMLLDNNEDYAMRVKYDTAFNTEANIAELDNLLSSDLTEGYMCAEVVADFIQNMFRTKAREIANREKIDVYLFCRNTENLMIELRYALGRYGANIQVSKLDELQTLKIKNRKGDSNSKKILEWFECQPLGREFTVSEFLNEVGIKAESFKAAKRGNDFIKELFEKMKLKNSRGKYCIVKV